MRNKLFNQKKKLIHLFIIISFFAYLFFADAIFARFVVNEESLMKRLDLPEVSDQVKLYVDKVEVKKVEWKELIMIQGWGHIIGHNTSEMHKRYIVLKSPRHQYIFETNFMLRPDVTEAFKESKLNLDYSGFNALISKDVLKDGKYNIGLLIEDKLSFSDCYLTIYRKNVTLE